MSFAGKINLLIATLGKKNFQYNIELIFDLNIINISLIVCLIIKKNLIDPAPDYLK